MSFLGDESAFRDRQLSVPTPVFSFPFAAALGAALAAGILSRMGLLVAPFLLLVMFGVFIVQLTRPWAGGRLVEGTVIGYDETAPLYHMTPERHRVPVVEYRDSMGSTHRMVEAHHVGSAPSVGTRYQVSLSPAAGKPRVLKDSNAGTALFFSAACFVPTLFLIGSLPVQVAVTLVFAFYLRSALQPAAPPPEVDAGLPQRLVVGTLSGLFFVLMLSALLGLLL